jgi:pyruvate dehydrogenase E2 component (dihydrolipoamide acetyltransferase)
MTQVFKLPDLGEGIHEAEIVTVKVKVGDTVREGDIIFEVETDKAVVEIPSPFTGTVSALHVQPGDRVVVGTVLIIFDGGPEIESPTPGQQTDPHNATAPADNAPAPRPGKIVPASPATRKLARELNVTLAQVPPTGPGGVVTAEDVRAFAAKKSTSPARPAAPEPPLPAAAQSASDPLPDFAQWGSVQRVALRGVRRATARQMALAWSRIPHVHSQDAVDITGLDAFRRNHKDKVAQMGGKLSLTVFVLKAVAAALKRYPNFNASLDSAADELILKQYYHIGVAVDTPDGLIVPVLRDVDRKSIVDLAIELSELVQRTRARRIKVEEMRGGSFTITNAGAMGGGYFAPIINHPEVAILGLGQARWQPVVEQMEPRREPRITARLILPLILSIDHRVLDGADAIRFLLTIKQGLEDPEELMMTMS